MDTQRQCSVSVWNDPPRRHTLADLVALFKVSCPSWTAWNCYNAARDILRRGWRTVAVGPYEQMEYIAAKMAIQGQSGFLVKVHRPIDGAAVRVFQHGPCALRNAGASAAAPWTPPDAWAGSWMKRAARIPNIPAIPVICNGTIAYQSQGEPRRFFCQVHGSWALHCCGLPLARLEGV
jgi:hypothetical protein